MISTEAQAILGLIDHMLKQLEELKGVPQSLRDDVFEGAIGWLRSDLFDEETPKVLEAYLNKIHGG